VNYAVNLISREKPFNPHPAPLRAKTDPSKTNWATRWLLGVLLVLILTGCGGLVVSFVSNQLPPVTATGTVVAISLTSGNDQFGTLVTITAVTLANTGVSTTVNFCGDQQPQFLINSVVQVKFTTGNPCSVLMTVTVLST